MNYQTIEEVYAANDRIHARLVETVREISDEQANALPDGEKWTIAQIVEHISIVAEGMAKISARLLKKARADGQKADGKVVLGEEFTRAAAESIHQKLEAPEMVRPTGNRPIAESLEKLEDSRRHLLELREMFETVDCSAYKFPHPLFGEMTAHEWLALVGGHEHRHLEQIRRRLATEE